MFKNMDYLNVYLGVEPLQSEFSNECSFVYQKKKKGK